MIVTGTRSLHGVREALANTLSHALLQHSRVAGARDPDAG